MKLISIRALSSAFVLSFSLTALGDPPPTPQNVIGAYIGGANYVRLTWEVTPGADGYNIYAYDSSNQVWQAVELGFTNANVTLTNVIWRQYNYGPMPATYSVTATNAEGESAASPTVTVDNTFVGFGADIQWPIVENGTLTPTNALLWFMNRAIPYGGDGMIEIGPADGTNLTIVGFDSFDAGGHGFWASNLTPATVYNFVATTAETNHLDSPYRYGWVDSIQFITPDTNHPPIAESRDAGLPWWIVDPEPLDFVINFSDYEYNSGVLYTIRIVAQPTNGTLASLTFQTYDLYTFLNYTPNQGARGEDHIDWVVNDGQWDSAPATLRITDLHFNRMPLVQPMLTNTPEDVPLTVGVSAPDPDGDSVTFECTGSLYGFAQLDETGTNVMYTPPPEWSGDDMVFMWAHDSYGGSTNFQIMITVTPVNDPVTLVGYDFETYEDQSYGVVPMVYDGEGDTLTFRATNGPSHGTLTGTTLPLIYTPAADYFGPDSFDIIANDGNSDSAPATINVVVIPINDSPVAYPTNAVTAEDTGVNIHVAGFDVEGEPLTFDIANPPAHGTVTNNGSDFVYTPEANYHGEDTFEFYVQDSQLPSVPALVTITITPVNDPPQPGQPVSSTITVNEDTSTNIVLTATDPEGSPLTYEVVNGPAHGTLTGTAPNLVYTPALNYNGADSLTFRVFDGELYSTTDGEVPITVAPVNDAPQAIANSIVTAEDTSTNVVLTGTDIEGASLTFEVADPPSHGTLTGTAPNLAYTPAANYNGGDAFTFRAYDGQTYSAAAQVTITVTAVNDAPVATPQSVSTAYNTALAITLAGTDVEGSSLTYTVLTQPSSGTLTGTAPNLTYTPVIGFSGAVSFTFSVNDGALNSASATVSITVNAAIAVPAAPSGLTATAVSTSQINLAWTDNSNNEDGLKIERSTSGSGWTQIATVGPNVQTYSSTGLTANKTYSYRVRAYNMLGNSGYSNTASAKTFK